MWSTTGSTQTARKLGGYGYVMATLGTGYDTRRLYNAYRQGYAEKNNGAAPAADRFGYLGLVAVGRTEAEARRRGELIASYPRSSGIVFAPFRNPPGYLSIEDNVRMLKGEGRPRSYTKDGRVVDMAKGSVQDLIDAGVMFCGTPDQVYDQIADFVDHCGGMGNLADDGPCRADVARRHGRKPDPVRAGSLSAAEGIASARTRRDRRGVICVHQPAAWCSCTNPPRTAP